MLLPHPHHPLAKYRRLIKFLGWSSILFILITGGITPHQYHRPDSQQGWLNVQSLLMYTLVSPTPPATPDDLRAALSAGFKANLILPPIVPPIAIEGNTLSTLTFLRIDLSGARPDFSHKAAKLNENIPPRDGIFVQNFEILAQPLLLGQAKIQYDLTATNARFQLFQDTASRPALVMTDAATGSVDLTAPIADLQSFATQEAKIIADKFGFLIRSVNFTLDSQSPHSIAVSIRVNFTVGVVNLKGSMDIDDDMNATASQLRCIGEGPVGLMVQQMLTPSLKDYEGRTRPLMEFPQRRMKLRDIQIKTDDALHITAKFGSPIAKP